MTRTSKSPEIGHGPHEAIAEKGRSDIRDVLKAKTRALSSFEVGQELRENEECPRNLLEEGGIYECRTHNSVYRLHVIEKSDATLKVTLHKQGQASTIQKGHLLMQSFSLNNPLVLFLDESGHRKVTSPLKGFKYKMKVVV